MTPSISSLSKGRSLALSFGSSQAVRHGALVLAALACVAGAHAQTLLANSPLFASTNVPGNLVLPLSVEFPTAVGNAHPDSTYVPANSYLGYFDPDKCYLYQPYAPETATLKSHFYPAGKAINHTCTGTSDQMWSGNFMNWSAMQTIDPFRWALTGGYRVIDSVGLTILEKAYASGQGGTSNFPNRLVTDSTVLAGATPFTGTTYQARIQGLGERMTMSVPGRTGSMLGMYYNNTTLSGTPALTRFDSVDFDWGGGSPGTDVNNDNFSARWTVNAVVPTTGNYQFQTVSDDGVRLYVNGVLVINQWTDHAPQTDTSVNIALTAGAKLGITLEYYERGGGAVMRLRWKPPGAADFTVYAPTADAQNTGSVAGIADPQLYVRVKVCDPSIDAGREEKNCVAYADGHFKPEGLMQQYADRIRYGVFGYLNDGNLSRDGGVLRAQQKFIAPTSPVPGSAAVANAAKEWDATTGVYLGNPDKADADQTAIDFSTAISNSGVLNYLNKFGEITRGNYKTYDQVSELYYSAIRYYKNQGNVASYTSMTGAGDATRATWADGFPVITRWNDPIQYSCQRNFILGIGDVNTHADKNLPGNTDSYNEPTVPAEVTADTTVSVVTATNKVGSLQGLGATFANSRNYPNCCTNNAPYMAGLAYDSNTKDIRPDIANMSGSVGQTVQTFWVDVLEGGYKKNNQYYLAAKYGGMKTPTSYLAYSDTAIDDSWWRTTTDTVGSGGSLQPRPDNYYTAGRPDQMVSGLTKAFASIASSLTAFTTSFSSALPQVVQLGNSSFSSQYDASNWTGEVTGGSLSFNATTGEPETGAKWKFTDRLAAQIAGTSTPRRIVTWNGSTGVAFRDTVATGGATKIADTDLDKLTTSWATINVADYVAYLRGDPTHEVGSSVTDSKKIYRTRVKPLGDIVGSRVQPVGPPSFPFSDATNPGYSAFKTTWKDRRTVVYVGANDGMLHAINGALEATGTTFESDENYGKEMFAYVPRALFQGPTAPNTDGLASLGNPTFVHHYMVNATPQVADLDFAKTPGGSGAANWRSVLIGGLGKGGKAYYAIDVTDPVTMATDIGGEEFVAGKVLWEFSAPELGYSFGAPMVMKTAKYGWVAVFTSGYNNSDGKGYFLFVNPRTGVLLEKVGTGAGGTTTDAGLAHANAFIIDATDGTADAIYAGDLLGNLWRLDVTGSGSYSATGKLVNMATLKDSSGTVQPVTSRPAIEVHPKTKQRFVMVGTGRLLDTTDIPSTQVQSFYSIVDGTNAAFNTKPLPLPSTATYPITRSMLQENTDYTDTVSFDPVTKAGWYENLGVDPGTPAKTSTGIGFRVITEPTTLLGRVAFSTNLPNGDVCNPSGRSRVYGRDYATTVSTIKSTTDTSVLTSFISIDGNITDLRFLSVDGTGALVYGTELGKVGRAGITSEVPFPLRRINWRELQVVD